MMAREEYIRIYRSSVPGATPSLTSGEIAANLVDGKLFVGATNADGSLRNVVFNDVRASVASIGVGHGLSASGSTGTITLFNMGVTSFNGATGAINYYLPFATDSITGVAAFNDKDFGVVSGVVSSRGVTGITAGYGLALSSLTGMVRILPTGLTTTASLDSFSVRGNELYLSLGQHTNLIKNSQDYFDWSPYNGVGTPTNIGDDSSKGWPASATGGIQIPFAANSNNGIYQTWPTGTLETNTTYTVSCWARTDSGTGKCRWSYYDDQSGAQTSYFSDDFNLTTVPQRIAFSFTTRSSAASSNVAFGNGSGNAAGTVLAWGFQLERGRFATDPIRTFGGIGTSTPRIIQINSGVTGIVAGHGLSSSGSSGTITLFNMGVTSFNGATGAINYYLPFATDSITGVAAFNDKDFGVVSGVVSSRGVTGISAGNTGIAIDGATGEVVVSNMGVLSFNGSTGHVSVSIGQTVTGDGGALIGANNSLITIRLADTTATGAASFSSTNFDVSEIGAVSIKNLGVPNAALVNSGFTLRDDSQQTSTVSLGDTLAITGGTGVVFRKTAEDNYVIYSNFTINGAPPNGNDFTVETDGKLSIPFATSSVTGVASFPSSYFSVAANGAVEILNPKITFIDATGSFVDVKTLGYGAGWTSLTLTAGSGIHVRLSPAFNPPGNALPVYTLFNTGVTSFNGSTGAINYYPPIANASGGTGLAYFRPGDFNVSGTGAVTLDSSVVKGATGHTVLGNGAITINAGAGNIRTVTVGLAGTSATGVAAFRDSNFDVSLTGAVSIKSGGVPNAALANSSVTVSAGTGLGGGGSVSLGNTVTLTNRGVTSFNGLTGAVTLTGDGGAILGVNNNSITARIVDCNGASGVVAFDCSVFTIDNGVVTGVKTITPGTACADCAGTAANSSECNACEGLGCNCTFLADMSGGKCICDPIAFDGNGLESEYDANGNLVALWVSADNLNNYTGDFTTKTTPKVVMFDPDEAGLQKTKAVTIQDLFVKNYNVFESKTPNQLASPNKKGSNDKIEFEIVTGLLAQGDQGLLKGGTAYEYIANNTISSINGCTGGTFSITGTEQEVTVTTGINCRQIVIGLPDSVRIPHISGTGGTFSGTITANKFVGSMDGGLF